MKCAGNYKGLACLMKKRWRVYTLLCIELGVVKVKDQALAKRMIDWGYSTGCFGTSMVSQVVLTWIIFFYSPPDPEAAFAPAMYAGAALAAGRVVGALADPLVAVWSDNRRGGAWGRRLPFMAGGGLPTVLAFTLLWRPPVAGSALINAIYLGLILSLFFFFYTVYTGPYLAILPELADTPERRLSLVEKQALFYIGGVAGAAVISGLLIDTYGFGVMSLVIGAMALLSFYVPVFQLRHVKWQPGDERRSFGSALQCIWQNRIFRLYVTAQVLFWFGLNMMVIAVPYVVTVLMFRDEGMVAMLMGLALCSALVGIGPITRAAKKRGTKAVYSFIMSWLGVNLLLIAFIGLGPVPAWLMGTIIVALAGIPMAGMFTLPNSLMAELAREGAATTGQRQEAAYFGVQGFMTKVSLVLSSTAASAILTAGGYQSGKDLGVRLLGLVAALCVGLGVVAFRKFPLGAPAPSSQPPAPPVPPPSSPTPPSLTRCG